MILELAHYNYPLPEAPGSQFETIAIVGTNDIHGNLAPVSAKTKEKGDAETLDYTYGGAAYLSSYVTALRTEWGKNLLWLDGGDLFQGTLESNTFFGKSVVDFLNSAQLTAAAIGNHEFDFGLDKLLNRMQESRFNYLAANIYDNTDTEKAIFPNTSPAQIYQAGSLKIGVIGLTTRQTPQSTGYKKISDFNFDNFKTAAIEQAALLRKKGAQIVLIVTHAGLQCNVNDNSLQNNLMLRSEKTLQNLCDNDEIPQLLNQIPQGTIDGVISGHTHSIVHQWINGVPVIQGKSYNRFFNVLYLTYDKKNHTVVHDNTRIEGPVPICPKIFSNQKNCDGSTTAPQNGRGKLSDFSFHHQVIAEDKKVTAVLAPYFKEINELKKEPVTFSESPVINSYDKESSFGNLTCDVLRKHTQADIAISNPGFIRINWDKGIINYDLLFRAYPIDNRISTFKVTGKNLKEMIKILQKGGNELYSASGLNQVITKNGDLKSLTLEKNQKIIDDKKYLIATTDFLVNGGSKFSEVKTKMQLEDVQTGDIIVRDVMYHYLKNLEKINTQQNPLINPAEPRLIVR